MKQRSKRYKNLISNREKNKKLNLKEIIKIIKDSPKIKFDESVDISMRINLKQSKGGDFNLRTVAKLPHGSGKKFKVAVLCEADKVSEAKKSGADVVGNDDLLEIISSGKFNFNKLICTPSMMSKIGKHGKVLGPKGLMPNPKLGTVTNDIIKTVNDIKSGLIELKNDKDGNIGASIGRKSYSSEKIEENYKFIIDFIKKEKPENIKGEFIKSISLSSTMGLSYRS